MTHYSEDIYWSYNPPVDIVMVGRNLHLLKDMDILDLCFDEEDSQAAALEDNLEVLEENLIVVVVVEENLD